MGRTRRLFFALWPDDLTRAALRKATRALARHSGGRPVEPANLHMTLGFLGHVPDERCPALLAIAARVAFPQFSLTLDRLGHFEVPQVLWIGPSVEPQALRSFVDGLRLELARAGLPVDPKPFHPHVTIARKVAVPPGLAPPRAVAWPVTGFALVESDTAPEGAHYRVMAAFPATA